MINVHDNLIFDHTYNHDHYWNEDNLGNYVVSKHYIKEFSDNKDHRDNFPLMHETIAFR